MMRTSLVFAVLFHAISSSVHAQQDDPRSGLAPGLHDAGEASHGMRLLSSTPRPARFVNAESPGDLDFANSDLAFQGTHVFVGNFNGFQVYDVTDPARPRLVSAVFCPGGQGDVSVRGSLLFMSVEQPRGRVDCGTGAPAEPVSAERFRGVRIFDISDIAQPRQVAAVQTCRGSHTHTLVPAPGDPSIVYVYVSGTSFVRPADELPGCSGLQPDEDPNTALFRIEVIRVPLAAPQDARIVSAPRVFADRATGNIAGLWRGGAHGEDTQRTARTDRCHDITVYPTLALAAGACSGNGILLDISDPVNPVRIDEVIDPNFAYWHSATFSNSGDVVIFTDEWGGGTQPRCRVTDRAEWGANALFRRTDGRLTLAGYYKLPVAQTPQENCVAHNGSLVPVPGRDIMVQAWYQGGVSVFDFTDPSSPFEIAYFDRGPIDAERLVIGGYFSTYWHNGRIYGAEMARGLDILELLPGEHLTHHELDAARLVRFDEFNPQTQPRLEWPAHPAVARAYLDQLRRSGGLPAELLTRVAGELDALERAAAAQRRTVLARLGTTAAALDGVAAGSTDARRVGLLADTLRGIAAAR